MTPNTMALLKGAHTATTSKRHLWWSLLSLSLIIELIDDDIWMFESMTCGAEADEPGIVVKEKSAFFHEPD